MDDFPSLWLPTLTRSSYFRPPTLSSHTIYFYFYFCTWKQVIHVVCWTYCHLPKSCMAPYLTGTFPNLVPLLSHQYCLERGYYPKHSYSTQHKVSASSNCASWRGRKANYRREISTPLNNHNEALCIYLFICRLTRVPPRNNQRGLLQHSNLTVDIGWWILG